MKDDYIKFTEEFKDLIENEKKSNKSIKAEIVKIDGDLLEVSTKFPSNLIKDRPVEVDRIPAKVIKANNKKILLKVTKNSNFKLNQLISIKNIQKDIIIHKLEETKDNITERNISKENEETLKSIIFQIDTSFTECNYFISNKLNKNQREAVKKSLESDKFHIIKGPPGTGKTHTIIEIIKQLYNEDKRILITAHTHIALDNIIERLSVINDNDIVRIGLQEKVNPLVLKYTLDEQIKSHPLYDEIIHKQKRIEELNSCPIKDSVVVSHIPKKENFFNKLFKSIFSIEENENSLNNYVGEVNETKNIEAINEIKSEIDYLKKIIQSDILMNSKIIASTVLSSSSFLTKDIEFDYVIMDEASQVPLYLSLIPLLKTNKFILIGDDKQLQPIQNMNSSYLLNKSIFNLFIEKYPDNYTFLNIQYRMNQEISDIASKLYYNGNLLTGETVKNQKLKLRNNDFLLLNDDSISFIDTSGIGFYESYMGGGCCNKYESQLILRIVESLLDNGIRGEEIGVITPYKKQKLYLQKLFSRENILVESDTIYRFQGREKDVIILSFCKSSNKSLTKFQKNFLADENQLNVSITRSRKKLIILGNYDMLRSALNIRKLVMSISPLNIIYLEDFI